MEWFLGLCRVWTFGLWGQFSGLIGKNYVLEHVEFRFVTLRLSTLNPET